ncbi:MAG: hypothetical protein AAF066_01760, partial [Pseudomonadota bacterium]
MKHALTQSHISRRTLLTASASVAALGLAAGAAVANTEAADLVIVNGKITTMDPARPEATALAAKDG